MHMTLRIEELEGPILLEVPFATSQVGGGITESFLQVSTGRARGVPVGLDALLFTADLQGRERALGDGPPGRLLGEVLAEAVDAAARRELDLQPRRIGVILAGDFYARPSLDRRGGSGDVRPVWRAYAERFGWVAGVAGNHDRFGPGWSLPDLEAFRLAERTHLLDGDVIELNNLRIAGVSGVVGNPRRPFRRTQETFDAEVARLATTAPHVLVMHDGPDVAGAQLRGMTSVREILEDAQPMLVVRGHSHWPRPLAELSNGTQVLNVDGRAVLLRSSP